MVNESDLTNLVKRYAQAKNAPLSGVGSFRWRFFDRRFILERIIDEMGRVRSLDLGDTKVSAYDWLSGLVHEATGYFDF